MCTHTGWLIGEGEANQAWQVNANADAIDTLCSCAPCASHYLSMHKGHRLEGEDDANQALQADINADATSHYLFMYMGYRIGQHSVSIPCVYVQAA